MQCLNQKPKHEYNGQPDKNISGNGTPYQVVQLVNKECHQYHIQYVPKVKMQRTEIEKGFHFTKVILSALHQYSKGASLIFLPYAV